MTPKTNIIVIFILITLVLLVGCTINDKNEENESMKEFRTDNESITGYSYDEGIYPDRAWEESVTNKDEPGSSSSEIIVTNKETAIAIASNEFKKVQQSGILQSYVLKGVFLDTKDNVWIVYFGEDTLIPGSCYNIAISKGTGEIIKMWPSE